jgi:hypothetical protein
MAAVLCDTAGMGEESACAGQAESGQERKPNRLHRFGSRPPLFKHASIESNAM